MPVPRQRVEGRAPRTRLSDAETQQRMLTAALDLLATQGISVGLDGLRFEDVVRAAGVSRTSAYRRWPTREAFLDDVLLELARGTELTGVGQRVVAEAEPLLQAQEGELDTPQGRHALLVDLLRLSFQANLEATVESPQFHTYLAVRAAVVGIPTPALREQVAAALRISERRAVARGAAIVAGAATLLGLRLAPPLTPPDGFTVVARGIAATSTGFVLAALADPTLVADTRPLAPYGATQSASWSVPALLLTGAVLQHLEHDPDATPTRSSIREGLTGLVQLGADAAAKVDPEGPPDD